MAEVATVRSFVTGSSQIDDGFVCDVSRGAGWGIVIHMTPQRRMWLWIMVAICGLISVGLGIYFIKIGMDRASELSGILGLFISISGLAISIYSVTQARSSRHAAQAGNVRMTQTSGNNSTNIQSAGDVNIGDNNTLGGR
ncbi:hypothetical protein [Streptomyces sp. NBC_01451]|uniref:hypothetical protein n=1 Tax=Streptomyces sp. NBC_01451 TaxID=2903872 RepID=UPI002E315723|nr:hypothetical protein [Streptomyces sp. NBC_01451]